ncbi:hypothetical protein EFY87_09655 [Flexivirga caeni]|uniref:Uncharacterized protein n=1 Tax=Flexivirga caeni TaxID=2294115 RepID=A0A3M9M9I2_9MICO|nr:hypothetical protein EFY87_09655 [Flexivirga caeni]
MPLLEEVPLLVGDTGDQTGAVVDVGAGDEGPCVGPVGCGLVGLDVGEPLGLVEPDEVDDGEVGVVLGLVGRLVGVVDGGVVDVVEGADPPLSGGRIAPGSTRGRVVGTGLFVATEPTPVAGIRRGDAGACSDVALVAEPVLVGPAAPEPKSALRWTKPMCRATWAMPPTPVTAAATPEMDRVPTVRAATTPALTCRCRRRA